MSSFECFRFSAAAPVSGADLSSMEPSGSSDLSKSDSGLVPENGPTPALTQDHGTVQGQGQVPVPGQGQGHMNTYTGYGGGVGMGYNGVGTGGYRQQQGGGYRGHPQQQQQQQGYGYQYPYGGMNMYGQAYQQQYSGDMSQFHKGHHQHQHYQQFYPQSNGYTTMQEGFQQPNAYVQMQQVLGQGQGQEGKHTGEVGQGQQVPKAAAPVDAALGVVRTGWSNGGARDKGDGGFSGLSADANGFVPAQVGGPEWDSRVKIAFEEKDGSRGERL
ncbi:unnamed protein product [Choristocarpus tenellus]